MSLNLSNTRLTPAATWVLAPDIAHCPVLSQLFFVVFPMGEGFLSYFFFVSVSARKLSLL
jgi:hypothetical protein